MVYFMNMQLKPTAVSYIVLKCSLPKTSSKDNRSFEVKQFLFLCRFCQWCTRMEPPTRAMPLTDPASVFGVTNDGQQVADVLRGRGQVKPTQGTDSDTLQGGALSSEIKVSRCL